jgi:hypothetical protein
MRRPILFVNPVTDVTFVRLAEGWVASGVDKAPELQRILRKSYSEAVVRVRDITGEHEIIWYVYRDGRYISGERGRG